MTYIFLVNQKKTSLNIESLYKSISVSDQNLIDGLSNSLLKTQKLIGRYLLSYGLKKIYNLNYQDYEITYNECGKPYFKDLDVHFSISHKNDLIACAISHDNIGIDIEKISEFPRVIQSKYFPNIKDNYELYKLWVSYESKVKELGTSIMNLKGLDIKGVNLVRLLDDYLMGVSGSPDFICQYL